MPPTDSVFSPLIFADQPLIPVDQIESAQDEIESAAITAIMVTLESLTERLLKLAEPALAQQDVAAINQLEWPFAGLLQPILYGLWSDGFNVGAEHGLEEMRALVEGAETFVRRFALADETQKEIDRLLKDAQAPQMINSGAVTAVLDRANYLSGNFSNDQLNQLKQDLIAAIVPQSGTNEPISRRELLERIQKNLQVGENRANLIARTETTYAYNTGRLASYQESTLVDYLRFIAIRDFRTSDICRSRDGMVIPLGEADAHRPPLHGYCRSVLSPVMSQLSSGKKLVEDPDRQPGNRILEPLPNGWRTSETQGAAVAALPAPVFWQDFVKRAEALHKLNLEALAVVNAKFVPTISELKAERAEVKARIDAGTKVKGDATKLRKLDAELKQLNADYAASAIPAMDELRNKVIANGNAALAATNAQSVNYFGGDLWDRPMKRGQAFFQPEVETLHRITNNQVTSLKTIAYVDPRGFSNKLGMINTGRYKDARWQREVVWHEFGHHLEYSRPELRDAAEEWIKSRATGPTEKLSVLTGIAKYRDNEVAYPDKFVNWYVGKLYPDGSTEVISVGLEHFFSAETMVRFYNLDQEHFLFILGALM